MSQHLHAWARFWAGFRDGASLGPLRRLVIPDYVITRGIVVVTLLMIGLVVWLSFR